MKTPNEIAAQRNSLERQMAALDDAEQAWFDLTRTQRVAELYHKEMCEMSHNSWEDNSCDFNKGDWSKPNIVQAGFHTKAEKIISTLPEDYTDEQILAVIEACK